MQIFLYKKNLIENCEKNYKQTCGKQKIANVSSVNECHKIDTSSPGGKNWTHEIEAKCARPVQDGVQTVKSHGIQKGYYFVCGTRIVSVLLHRTQNTVLRKWQICLLMCGETKTLSIQNKVLRFEVRNPLSYLKFSWKKYIVCIVNITNVV